MRAHHHWIIDCCCPTVRIDMKLIRNFVLLSLLPLLSHAAAKCKDPNAKSVEIFLVGKSAKETDICVTNKFCDDYDGLCEGSGTSSICCVIETEVCPSGYELPRSSSNSPKLMSCSTDSDCSSDGSIQCLSVSGRKTDHCCTKKALSTSTPLCPGGSIVGSNCQNTGECSATEYCVKHGTTSSCCPRLTCVGTLTTPGRHEKPGNKYAEDVYIVEKESGGQCSQGFESSKITGYTSASSVPETPTCCPVPYSLLTYTAKTKPVLDNNGKYKKCTQTGNECVAGSEYCGSVYNPLYDKDAELQLLLCYPLPTAPAGITIKNVAVCEQNSDCNGRNEFCLRGDYYNGDSKTKTGLCAEFQCGKGFKEGKSPAGICANNRNCDGVQTQTDLLVQYPDKNKDDFPSHCVQNKGGVTIGICCVDISSETTDHCPSPGHLALDASGQKIDCSTNGVQDCVAGTRLKEKELRCGPSKLCCKDASYAACPGTVISTIGEKTCKKNDDCGKFGQCYSGNCCPAIPPLGPFCMKQKYHDIKNLPNYRGPNDELCLFGAKNAYGESNAVGQACSATSTCPANQVCVSEGSGVFNCYLDPNVKTTHELSSLWKYTLIAGVVCFFVFGAISLIFFVAYRSRSMMDHKKEKKNKKKGKKGKKSKSETSS